MQQSPNSLAGEWLSAFRPASWHAGGQRFESAWLHSVRLLVLQGVFFVGQWDAGRPGRAEKCPIDRPEWVPGSGLLSCSGEGARDGIAVLLQLTDPRQQLREVRELPAQHP